MVTVEEVQHLRNEHKMSTRAIAEVFGCSQATVVDRLRYGKRKHLSDIPDAKITMQQRDKVIEIAVADLKTLYVDKQLSGKEIAQQLRCNSDSIYKALRELSWLRPLSEVYRLRRGSKNGKWKGGRYVRGGYVYVKAEDHPRADQFGYVPEHILIWEQYHGKAVPPSHVIHHLNGIKSDNRPANLKALLEKRHWRLIPALKNRICELEAENRRLRGVPEET